jgi:spoIIIJ-associated protein
MKSIEIRARSVADAVELALSQLGKDRDDVIIAVLDAGESGDEALVRVTVVDDEDDATPPAPAAAISAPAPRAAPITTPASTEDTNDVAVIARTILETMLQHMDIHGYVSAVRGHEPAEDGTLEETITLHIEGADEQAMGLLIGRRGETLASLQFLLNLMVSRKVKHWPQMIVDVGNYRQRRRESLEGLARRTADRVRQTGRSVSLEPMAPYERRLVHLALRGDTSVYTQSTGEGEGRKITIHPAKHRP